MASVIPATVDAAKVASVVAAAIAVLPVLPPLAEDENQSRGLRWPEPTPCRCSRNGRWEQQVRAAVGVMAKDHAVLRSD